MEDRRCNRKEKEIRLMTRKALQLGLCLLATSALAAFDAPAARAIDLSYTQSGVGGTMAQACNNAIQKIENNCDMHGSITTNPGSCKPLWGIDGSVIGQVCTCKATASYCANTIPFPGF
jgi:hypothetical protein